MRLTDQQQAIVNHLRGPALVFAVAGSGKTTCMVHRIKNLTEQGIVRPNRILATSFNTAAVRDITTQLQDLDVSGVDCRTLHSLGYHIIRLATQHGFLDKGWINRQSNDNIGEQLIGKTLTSLSRSSGMDLSEMHIDREDLTNQISIWKGNLIYPDLEKAELSADAREFASQAKHNNKLYVEAYAIYETLRKQEQIITFDDMLQTGWELLAGVPELLHEVQETYDSVIVDEFQDVNYAQYLIMDLITRLHRNYMAIGDDDQCIYEWRGANPGFILGFEEAYNAKVYKISDNFRCPAQHLALANAVVEQNKKRYDKHLSLTRGFDGETFIHNCKDDWAIARNITAEIKEQLKSGRSIDEMVVLIRLYSETAFLETAFMDEGMRYKIEGNAPFYKRAELVTLFKYLSFAKFDQQIRKRGYPKSPDQAEKYAAMFQAIINRPRRYISYNFISFVIQQARRKGRSILDIAERELDQLKKRPRKQMEEFILMIRRLSGQLRKPADKTLRWLIIKIEYKSHLLEISGQKEVGITRLQTVEALIEFARTRGTCLELLEHVRELTAHPPSASGNPIRIMTIYRAKGLEWEVVFMPGCREGLLPCSIDGKSDANSPEVEAERRLFYVALTRSKEMLHLYRNNLHEMSPFLAQAKSDDLLQELEAFRKTLYSNRLVSKENDLINLARGIGRFKLERFLMYWQVLPDTMKNNLKLLIRNMSHKLEEAESVYAAYYEEMEHYRQQQKDQINQAVNAEDRLLEIAIFIRKYQNAFHHFETGDELTFEMDEQGDIMAVAQRSLAGFVELDESPELIETVLDWDKCEGVITEVIDRTGWIEARLTEVTCLSADSLVDLPPPPKPPDNDFLRIATPEFQEGIDVLKELVGS
ncbi:MAG: ATP-dependent helicase [Calditrichia bacterium]